MNATEIKTYSAYASEGIARIRLSNLINCGLQLKTPQETAVRDLEELMIIHGNVPVELETEWMERNFAFSS